MHLPSLENSARGQSIAYIKDLAKSFWSFFENIFRDNTTRKKIKNPAVHTRNAIIVIHNIITYPIKYKNLIITLYFYIYNLIIKFIFYIYFDSLDSML